ncbi:hypothetical protein ASPVEDRAFT_44823 [Aspergillus versicolor CBS 583.65]|uniref:Zn(2)-C6 fungal-type domain-containing protein n=1 Tax=Aspergillus versicolor CBS 583.65 TaxID=1036611 RepID=A0A1L9PUZ8_ASPVE|nr:uncharacterized protein ASPVEDRAFT_44823 [Aspergillus versicolor CBS 583.65]OJJ05338.1 hypothetical protein ASPVEDRAFT_44823 [Aspergillus versicolor CBS 583.65]
MQSPIDPTEHNEAAHPANPRNKRAKYTAKACEYCHRRKIKCNGEFPCQACQRTERECVKDYTPTYRVLPGRKRKRGQQAELSNTEEDDEPPSSTTSLILERLSEIERRLHQIAPKPNILDHGPGLEQTETFTDPEQTADSAACCEAHNDIQEDHGNSDTEPEGGDETSYVGETSIDRTLRHVEESLYELEVPAQEAESSAIVSPGSALLGEGNTAGSSWQRMRVLEVLTAHKLSPQKADWDVLLDLFCEDVHPLYPFLHLPSLRRSYAYLSDHGADSTEPDIAGMDSFVQVLICLALGRCTTSVRAETGEGTQSSGWTFYCAALDCLGDIYKPSGENGSGLPRLQVLTLMVVYLIRIHANERAQKVLSLAIVEACHLGLHREIVLNTVPVFCAEYARRLWWCLYILDRRLALDVGQPFLIQDTNTDTDLPLLLSETTLDQLRHNTATTPVPADEPVQGGNTPIPYLISMTGYSKIVGKVWNALYQAHSMDRASDPALTDSFEELLAMWERTLPADLACDELNPHSDSYSNAARRPWQLKNKFLIRIRSLWLRIIIRKPMRSRSSSIVWIENFDNESTCIALADRIVVFFSRIFEPHRIYTFPFLQYLLGAASTILGLVIRTPAFRQRHTSSVVQAAQMMNTFCANWVSGKTLRSVRRYTDMVAKVVGGGDARIPGNIAINTPESVPTRLLSDTDRQRRGQSHTRRQSSADFAGKKSDAEVRNGETSTRSYPTLQLPSVTPAFEFLDAQDPSAAPDLLHNFAPDLANLVLADYPFEMSVSDRNLLHASTSCMTDSYSAALFDLNTLNQV